MSQKFSNAHEFFRTCQVGDECADSTDRSRNLYVATNITTDDQGKRVVIFDEVSVMHYRKQYTMTLRHGQKVTNIRDTGYGRVFSLAGPAPLALLPAENAPRFSAKRIDGLHADAVTAYRAYTATQAAA